MQKSVVLILAVALALVLLILFYEPAPTPPPPEAGVPVVDTAGGSSSGGSTLAAAPDIDLESPAPQRAPATPAPAAATASVSGWVSDSFGAGIGNIAVQIESHGFDGEGMTAFTTRSNQRGEFGFVRLVPGRLYRLEIEPQRNYAAFSIESFSAEDAAALEHIVLEQIDLVGADGMIVDTSGAPVADFELSIRSQSAQFPDRVIRSDASGYFRLDNFPAGELRIATNASDYYRIKGLELRPDEYRNLTLIIDKGNYYLSGQVSDANGAPVAQAQVTLKSAFATADYHSYSYRSTATDDNGRFEFDGLGGKQLTLGVYARGFDTHIQRYDFVSFADRVDIVLVATP